MIIVNVKKVYPNYKGWSYQTITVESLEEFEEMIFGRMKCEAVASINFDYKNFKVTFTYEDKPNSILYVIQKIVSKKLKSYTLKEGKEKGDPQEVKLWEEEELYSCGFLSLASRKCDPKVEEWFKHCNARRMERLAA